MRSKDILYSEGYTVEEKGYTSQEEGAGYKRIDVGARGRVMNSTEGYRLQGNRYRAQDVVYMVPTQRELKCLGVEKNVKKTSGRG